MIELKEKYKTPSEFADFIGLERMLYIRQTQKR